MTSHHLGHILLVRTNLSIQSTLKGWGLWKRVSTRKWGSQKVYLPQHKLPTEKRPFCGICGVCKKVKFEATGCLSWKMKIKCNLRKVLGAWKLHFVKSNVIENIEANAFRTSKWQRRKGTKIFYYLLVGRYFKLPFNLHFTSSRWILLSLVYV